MNGTWNVWNVTISHTVVTDSSGNILSVNNDQNYVALATKAYGELTVASGWTTFSLNITGLEPITGSVYAEITSSKLFNPFALNGDTTVTKTELSSIVRSFGSLPGAASYDQRLDFCQHYKIDICDLATAAANLGQ